MHRSKGFTLTEVLVVIGIICILASLGFFASAPSREAARQSSCANQLKQFYVVAQLTPPTTTTAMVIPNCTAWHICPPMDVARLTN